MPTSMIVGTVGVTQYRQTLEQAVQSGDAVLEVGCHLGTSTVIVNEKASAHRSGGYCIGCHGLASGCHADTQALANGLQNAAQNKGAAANHQVT